MPIRTSRVRYNEVRTRLAAQMARRGDKDEEDDKPESRDAPVKGRRGRSHRPFSVLVRQFWGTLTGQRRVIVTALFVMGLGTVIGLIPPWATKVAVDNVLGDDPLPAWAAPVLEGLDPYRQLGVLAAVMVTVTLIGAFVGLAGRWMTTVATQKVQVSVRRRVFEHALSLPLDKVQDLKTGGVTSLIREDAGGVAELIFSLLYHPIGAMIQLVGSFIVLAIVDWRLLIGALMLAPVVFWSHRAWINRIRPLHRAVRAQRDEIDGHAVEAFGGIRVVRTFGRERSERNRFVFGNDLLVREQLLAWRWMRGIELVWQTILPLASIALLVYGGTLVLRGELSLGDVMMFIVYLGMLLGPVAALANAAASFQTHLAGLDRVLDMLEEQPEFHAQAVRRPLEAARVRGAITLDGVGFSYPGQETPVLADVTLDVRPGQTIALVGPSGSGKTTLCNLIARFYDPTTGRILLDGADVRDLDLEDYRGLLGIVEQDVFLFDGTIRDNLTYGRPRASDAELLAAVEAANALEYIERLPEKFETLIGERGVKLSGGQRQRLAIARAILADPKILILDEATSNLDSESERLIQGSLSRLLEGRTSFVIAHRLSTITHADQIVVLQNGRVVEVGTHDQLCERSGLYRRMVELQTAPTEPRLEEEASEAVAAT